MLPYQLTLPCLLLLSTHITHASSIYIQNALFILAETIGFGFIDFPMQGILRKILATIYEKEGKLEMAMAWLCVSVAIGLTWMSALGTTIPAEGNCCIIMVIGLIGAASSRFLPKEATAGTHTPKAKDGAPVGFGETELELQQ
jgi:hypothetical protein